MRAERGELMLLLVVERSSAMNEPANLGTNETKWDVLVPALAATLRELASSTDSSYVNVRLGLLLFPSSLTSQAESGATGTNAACRVALGERAIAVEPMPISDALPTVFDALMAEPPSGATPTAAALEQALVYLKAGNFSGGHYVLLATNGMSDCGKSLTCAPDACTENLRGTCASDNCCESRSYLCQDDAAVITALENLGAAGFHTIVTGFPSTGADTEALNAFAVVGGVPNTAGETQFYPVLGSRTIPELDQLWNVSTTSSDRSCTFPLERMPADPSSLRVMVDCAPLPEFSDTSGSRNWLFVPEEQAVAIQGPVCSMIEMQPVREVDLIADCP